MESSYKFPVIITSGADISGLTLINCNKGAVDVTPTRAELDRLYFNIAAVITRITGGLCLVNQWLLYDLYSFEKLYETEWKIYKLVK